MTTEEAKKAGFRPTRTALMNCWHLTKAGSIENVGVEFDNLSADDFPTRAKAREALRRRKMEAATKREEARVEARKAAGTHVPPPTPSETPAEKDALDKAKLVKYQQQHSYMDDAQYAACVEARDWDGADLRVDALDKAKAEAEPLEWCERKVGELIEATDSIWDWLSECWQEPHGRHVGEKLECDDMGCVNFRARYRNPLWLAKHGKDVESHETPVGETQAKEVVTDETQHSPSRPLSDAEFKKLVGRMSLPQLYDALKANGIKLEGIGLEPKQVDEQSVLEEAAKCVTGPRRRDYGTPDENFSLIASLWSVQLKHEVTPMQVALCLILLKVARQSNSPKRDNLVDIAGYAQCASELKGAK